MSIVDLGTTLMISLAIGRAIRAVLRGHGIMAARVVVADGVVSALGLAVAATLMRTIVLQSWLDVATFAIIYAIRTILKRVFLWERATLRCNTAT